jgi:3-phenylpropionate/trans-cinnamate dioxygenase ferredoxin reductase subunit
VVVGSGFIGSEVAASARTLDVAVTMLEVLPVPLGRVLGPRVGAIYAEIHRAHSVDLRLGETVAELRGRERVEAVVSERGETIPCGLVVVGVGMRPADDWLIGSGVTLHDGALVDEYCETNVPSIFAAGDVARWPLLPDGERVRLEHYDNALRQGEVAVRNMLGARQPYAPVPYFWSDQYQWRLQFVGLARPDDTVVLRGHPPDQPFIAFYLRAGRVVAALAVNQMRELGTIKRLIAANVAPDPAALADEGAPLKSLLSSPH